MTVDTSAKEHQVLEPEELTRFLKYLSGERRLSPYTVRNYGQAVRGFDKWYRSHRSEASSQSVGYFAASMDEVRLFLRECQSKWGRRTLHNHVAALRSFFKYLRQQGKVRENPFGGLELPRLERSLPRFLTEKQMRALLAGPLLRLEHEKRSPAMAWRDRLVLELLYGAGLRVSELVSLDYGDVDWNDGVVRVMGKGKKERLSPLGRVALECLQKFKVEWAPAVDRTSPILVNDKSLKGDCQGGPPQRLGVRQVQLMVKHYLALAGLPRDLSPHKIRHSYATHLLNRGAELRVVQELLGHASLSTTQVYTHVGIARLKATHQQAHPRG